MKKKHIIIWQSGEPLQIDADDHNPMRAISLSEYLSKKFFKVTLISSNFNHTKKKFRFGKVKKFKKIKINKNLNLVLINSPGYKKNISLSRLVDHFILGINLKYFLNFSKEDIDFAIIGFPPIETSIFLSNWLFLNKIPYIFDIKDLWPEYFYERIKNRLLASIIKLIFCIHDLYLKKSFKNSSGIIANNSFFLKFILKKINRKKTKNDHVVYLTKPIVNYNSTLFLKKNKFDKKKFNIYFCGRVDLEVFDFETVFKALNILKNKNSSFHFYIGGYGEIKKLKNLIGIYNLNDCVSLLGFMNKYNHSLLLKKCDLFIAPFNNSINFSSNLSNKFIEAIQYNLPILTPLKKDVSKFILKNKIGYIYKENNHLDLFKKIMQMINKKYQMKLIKLNLKKLSNNEFNHNNNYLKFLNTINNFN